MMKRGLPPVFNEDEENAGDNDNIENANNCFTLNVQDLESKSKSDDRYFVCYMIHEVEKEIVIDPTMMSVSSANNNDSSRTTFMDVPIVAQKKKRSGSLDNNMIIPTFTVSRTCVTVSNAMTVLPNGGFATDLSV